jgi:hypothetical protein
MFYVDKAANAATSTALEQVINLTILVTAI